jgi:hypothetical protein
MESIMSGWFMLILGLLNLCVAVTLFAEGQQGMALAYFCYAVSNAGLYAASRG